MPLQLTQKLIEESNKPLIVKAFATWCPHCAAMKPIYEQLEQELGKSYTFTEFDIDQFPDLTSLLKITALPTFIFMKDEKEGGRIVGETSYDELKEGIEQYLK